MVYKYLLPFCGLPFLLVVSFDVQKFFILLKSTLFLSFVACPFGVMSKKSLPNQMS